MSKKPCKVLKMSRRVLAETIGIAPRYLANIENIGTLPSLPVFYAIVKLCKLPIERYCFPETDKKGSKERQRAQMKLNLCSQQEGAVGRESDGAVRDDAGIAGTAGTVIDQYGTVTIPDGQTADVELPGGSTITLTGGSTIDKDGTVTVGGGGATLSLKGSGLQLQMAAETVLIIDAETPLGLYCQGLFSG